MTYDTDQKKFTVVSHDTTTDARHIDYFDSVVCCNGAPRDLVEPLLQANPTAAATADLDGFLPLVGALSCGAAADVVDLLLAAHPGAASVMVQGRTPLHYAVSHGCDVRVTNCVEIKIFTACSC